MGLAFVRSKKQLSEGGRVLVCRDEPAICIEYVQVEFCEQLGETALQIPALY